MRSLEIPMGRKDSVATSVGGMLALNVIPREGTVPRDQVHGEEEVGGWTG